MRKLLNTLYVTTPEAYLTKDGENVVIRVKEKDIFRIPVLNIEGIVTFGYIGASPALMKMCAERNVGLCFLSANGQFQSRVSGPTKGNVLLRRTQYRIADDANKSLEISRLFIAGKIANSRTVIDRFKRDHISSDKQLSLFLSVSEKLKRSKNQALVAESSDTLRGIEGEAATTYFSVFNQMIISQCEDFPFNGRNRRPPKDKVNALLSFVYTLLNHEVQSALETVGLDPYVGFLHTD
jgi:CRISPR-associated endonuclease cas1